MHEVPIIRAIVWQVLRQQLLSQTMDRLIRVDDPTGVTDDMFLSLKSTLDLDTFLEADEAMAFGIVDKVFETRPEGDTHDADGSGGAPD